MASEQEDHLLRVDTQMFQNLPTVDTVSLLFLQLDPSPKVILF